MDKTVIYPQFRWPGLAILLVLYGLRVSSLSGWYIVTYGLAIYLLNLFIGFITPQVSEVFGVLLWERYIIVRNLRDRRNGMPGFIAITERAMNKRGKRGGKGKGRKKGGTPTIFWRAP